MFKVKMVLWFIIPFLCLVIGLKNFYGESAKKESPAQSKYDSAVKLRDSGNIGKAISEFKVAIKIDDKFIPAYNDLALLYSQLGNKKEAVSTLKKAIDKNPTYTVTHYNLGIIYEDIKDYKKALSEYEFAKKLDSNFVPAYHRVGLLHYNKEDYAAAIDVLKKAVDLNIQTPDMNEVRYNLARAYAKKDMFKESSAQLGEILLTEPADTPLAKSTAELNNYVKMMLNTQPKKEGK